MVRWFDNIRRRLTQSAVEGVLSLNRWLGVNGAVHLGHALGRVSRWTEPLRRRLAANFRAAGIRPTEHLIDDYFDFFGQWVGLSLSVYQKSVEELGLAARVTFDDTLAYLDEAVARGKGVVLAAPHVFGHDISAGVIHQRHPIHAIVRESKSPSRGAIKDRWYKALGVETVFRARHASLVNDTLKYIRLLRGGNILALTPDLPTKPNMGLPVWIFGRQVHLSPGAVMLAMRSGAALVTCLGGREPAQKNDLLPRAKLRFTKPIVFAPAKGQRERVMHQGLQDWTRVLEDYLREDPVNWMFWLDKRWTRILRTPAIQTV